MSQGDRIVRLASRLRAWGMDGLAATLLEAGGPLTFMGAQALYFAAPVLSAFTPEEELAGLARLLEDPASVRALAEHLTETPSRQAQKTEDD